MITSPAFAGKRYAILGLARSGLATLDALVASGASCIAWDNREEARAAVADRAEIGDPMEIDLSGLDGLVVSPGVPLNSHPVADRARATGLPIIGDIELFAMARENLPKHKVVGITGTNGKSTTTALIHHILHSAGVPSLMGGNIGLPILSQNPLPEGGVYVLELSSYQIDLTFTLDCDVAVLLNITPDHLDRYDGFAGYVASKARLFDMMSSAHVAVISGEDEQSRQIASANARIVQPQLAAINADDQVLWPSLAGPHNAQNARVAITVADALGIDKAAIRKALATFSSLPHRMQRIASKDGVLFVNDSKATNAASTAPALAAYPKIHWILGGVPKEDHLNECVPYFGNVVHAYTIGEAGPMFAKLLEPSMPVTRAEMMCEAVKAAIANARSGEVIMLSPACASFDQFRDFEARGDHFTKIVNALIGEGHASDCQTVHGGAVS